jgi:hypothetical protein
MNDSFEEDTLHELFYSPTYDRYWKSFNGMVDRVISDWNESSDTLGLPSQPIKKTWKQKLGLSKKRVETMLPTYTESQKNKNWIEYKRLSSYLKLDKSIRGNPILKRYSRSRLYNFVSSQFSHRKVDHKTMDRFFKSCRLLTVELLSRMKEINQSFDKSDLLKACRCFWISLYWNWLLNTDEILPVIPYNYAERDGTRISESILAFVTLYPLTDNHFDSSLEWEDKVKLSDLIKHKISGAKVYPQQEEVATIFDMISNIESDYGRGTNGFINDSDYAHIWFSLLSIQDAQISSAELDNSNLFGHLFDWKEYLDKNPYTEDMSFPQSSTDTHLPSILLNTARKGGAAMLSIGLLVEPSFLPEDWLLYALKIGFILQLIDDLQDVKEDLKAGRLTLFTYSIYKDIPFDKNIIKLLNFIMGLKVPNSSAEAGDLMNWTLVKGLSMLVLEATSRLPEFKVSAEFRKFIDDRIPFPPKKEMESIECLMYEIFTQGL